MKNSKEYVLSHDFGYGQEKELETLKRLKLRNKDDLGVYVDDVITNAFDAKYQDNVIEFNKGKSKYKVVIERI